MSRNSLDIESIPDLNKIELLEPIEAPATYKDPAKIEAYREEGRKKQIEKMGLSPFTGRICSFSMFGESENFFKVISEISDAAEIELVTEILGKLIVGKQEPNTLITWNGFNFDFPYIYKRAILLKISLPEGCPGLKYWTRKYASDVHIDIMQELAGWSIENRLNLDFVGKLFLGSGKTHRDYREYVELIKTGKGELIGLDNLNDSEHTYKIYKMVEPYLF
jgi:DNA polymerase elongation subunit (family B)